MLLRWAEDADTWDREQEQGTSICQAISHSVIQTFSRIVTKSVTISNASELSTQCVECPALSPSWPQRYFSANVQPGQESYQSSRPCNLGGEGCDPCRAVTAQSSGYYVSRTLCILG